MLEHGDAAAAARPAATATAASSAASQAATGGRSSSHSTPLAAQVGERGAARVAHRGVAARQIDGAQVADPLVTRSLSAPTQQELTAPDRAVVAVAGAVERDAEDRACPAGRVRRATTRRARGGAGRAAAAARRAAGVPLGPRPGQVGRVGVGGDRPRARGGAASSAARPPGSKARSRVEAAHVADVRRAERVRRRRRCRRCSSARRRRRASPAGRVRAPPATARTRASGGSAVRAPSKHPHDAVVARHVDRPVVGEHRVGQPGQPSRGVEVVEAQRLVADVRTRHARACPAAACSAPGTGASSRWCTGL